MIGKDDDILMHLPDGRGAVTDIRIRFPEFQPSWVQSAVQQCEKSYLGARKLEAVKAGNLKSGESMLLQLQTGKLEGIQFVTLYVDGEFRGITNTAPYAFTIDTATFAEGAHLAELSAVNGNGGMLKRVVTKFYVQAKKAARL